MIFSQARSAAHSLPRHSNMELKEYMKRGIVNATIYQNQEQVGRIAVRSAYDYLVRSTSYGNEMIETSKTVCIRPCLYLLADIEE